MLHSGLQVSAEGGVEVRVVGKILGGIEPGEGRKSTLGKTVLDEMLLARDGVGAECLEQIGIGIDVSLRIEEGMTALGVAGLDVFLLGGSSVGAVGLDQVSIGRDVVEGIEAGGEGAGESDGTLFLWAEPGATAGVAGGRQRQPGERQLRRGTPVLHH